MLKSIRDLNKLKQYVISIKLHKKLQNLLKSIAKVEKKLYNSSMSNYGRNFFMTCNKNVIKT